MGKHFYLDNCKQCINFDLGCKGTKILNGTEMCSYHGWMKRKREKPCLLCGGLKFKYFVVLSSYSVGSNDVGNATCSGSDTNFLYNCIKCDAIYRAKE